MPLARRFSTIALPCILIFLYIAVRCFTVDITHDEAYSFKVMKHFWYAEALCTGNTHWLNSIAIKAAILSGFEKNWQIRWFSMLSAAIFIFISYRWIISFKRTGMRIFAFALLLLNPYVTDYLGLARGYSSGIMFEMAAILLLFKRRADNHGYKASIGLLCAALSAISNYSFAFFFAGYGMVYFLNDYFRKGARFLKSRYFYLDMFLCAGVSLFIIRALIFNFRCSGDIVGAGTANLTDVSSMFIADLFYGNLNLRGWLPVALAVLLICFITIVCVFGLSGKTEIQNPAYHYASAILSLTLFLIAAAHFVFHIVLPYARSALFLFPLICLNIVYFADSVKTKSVILAAVSALLIANFCLSMSFTSALDFEAQEGTKEVFAQIDKMQIKNVVMGKWTYGVYINYYRQTDHPYYRFHGSYADSITCSRDTLYALLSEPYRFKLTSCYKADTLLKPKAGNMILVKLLKVADNQRVN